MWLVVAVPSVALDLLFRVSLHGSLLLPLLVVLRLCADGADFDRLETALAAK